MDSEEKGAAIEPTDAEVIAAKGVTVTLCGNDYYWPKPCIRDQRDMKAAIFLIPELQGLQRFVGMTKEEVVGFQTMADLAMAVTLPNKMLDFMCQFNPDMAADTELLNDAEADEIHTAFGTIQDMLNGPLSSKPTRRGRKKRSTHTQKAAFTRSV